MKKAKRMIALFVCALCMFLYMMPYAALAEDDQTGSEAPAATAAPTPKPADTPAPTQTPAPAPTATPAPVPTAAPTASQKPAETGMPAATNTPPAATATAAATPTAAATATTAATPAATPSATPAVTSTPEPTVEPTAEAEKPLSVEVTITSKSVFAGKNNMKAKLSVSGGSGDYSVVFTVKRGSSEVYTSDAMPCSGSMTFTYSPTRYGRHTVTAVVTDSRGNSAKDSDKMDVAEEDKETQAEWERTMWGCEITGDWRADIITIARSQLGYEASRTDFYVSGDTTRRYNRYGEWMGEPYREWCAMFVSFCVHYADIPDYMFHYEYTSENMKECMIHFGAYVVNVREYAPQPGDLIFFNWEKEEDPEHIGIVEKVDDKYVYTIEGNVVNSVKRQRYRIDDKRIIGYGNVEVIMRFNDVPVYYCGDYEHVHVAECEVRPSYCGFEAHQHETECADDEGVVVCGIPPHEHNYTCYLPPYVPEEEQ